MIRSLPLALAGLAIAGCAAAQSVAPLGALTSRGTVQPTDLVPIVSATGPTLQKTTVGALQTVTPTGANTAVALPDALARTLYVNDFAASMPAGTPDDCVHDATPAVNAAHAALGTAGGMIVFDRTAGCYLVNVVMGAGWDGAMLQGASQQRFIGGPLGNYIGAFDGTRCAIQVGDTTANVSGWGLRDLAIYGGVTPTEQCGIKFVDGANYGTLDNVSVLNFTNALAWFYSNYVGNRAITNISWHGGSLANYHAGDGLLLDGENSGYVNGITISGVPISSNGVGHPVRLIGQAILNLEGSYVEDGGAAALSLEKTTSAVCPTINMAGGNLDNGGAASALNIENQWGDLQSSGYQVCAPNIVGVSTSASALSVATATTGTISAGSPTLTVASATGAAVGRTVLVYGAGAAAPDSVTTGDNGYYPFSATIVGVSGTTITLSANATTAVTGGKVEIGDVNRQGVASAGAPAIRANGIGLGIMNVTDFTALALDHFLYRSIGTGTFFPFNNFTDIWQNPTLDIAQDMGAGATLTSLTRSGSTVTAVIGSPGLIRVGDLITITGEQAASGINGTFPIATWNGGTSTLTFTSPVSGTVSAYTGSPTIRIFKQTIAQNGNLTVSGAYNMVSNTGVAGAVLNSSNTLDGITISPPDAVNGSITIASGSSPSAIIQFLAGGIITGGNNGYGSLGIGGNSTAGQRSIEFFGASADPVQTPAANDLFLYSVGGLARIKDQNGNVGEVFSTQHGATYAYATPTTGTTVIIADTANAEIVDPAGTLAALTVQLPTCSAAYDGKVAWFSSSTAITALTVTATAGTVKTAPSTLAAGAGARYLCRGANTTWYQGA